MIDIFPMPREFNLAVLLVNCGAVSKASDKDPEIYPNIAGLGPDWFLVRFETEPVGGFRNYLVDWNCGNPLAVATAPALSPIDDAIGKGTIKNQIPKRSNDKRKNVALTVGEWGLLRDLSSGRNQGQLATEETLRTALEAGLVETIGTVKETGRPLVGITSKGKRHVAAENQRRKMLGLEDREPGKVVVDNNFRTETEYTIKTSHPNWEPGNGVQAVRVVTVKEDGKPNGERYVLGGSFGCSRNYKAPDDRAAIVNLLAEHGCQLVDIDAKG